MHRIMISHATVDQRIAEVVKALLQKCSLNQIQPWFSSDPSFGGIGAGRRWFEQIREEIASSSSVVVLMTPRSVQSSWVIFEAGFGAGVAERELMPLIIGLDDMSKVPNPISHWQTFRLDDHQTASSFIQKVLGVFGIAFDQDLFQAAATRALSELESLETRPPPPPSLVNEVDPGLKRYLDARFFELAGAISKGRSSQADYRIEITNDIEERIQSLLITETTSLGDALDEIYFAMQGSVKPFTYLEDWILVDDTMDSPIIVREVQHRIPAHYVLVADHIFRVVGLEAPIDTKDRSFATRQSRGRG